MKKMPPKLYELSQSDLDEDDVQYIFDYLIEAEGVGVKFVNVYFYPTEITFLRSNNRAEADNQLRMAIDRVNVKSFGFENTGDTWEERKGSG